MRRAAEASWPSGRIFHCIAGLFGKSEAGRAQARSATPGEGGGGAVKVTPQPWGILGTQAPPRNPACARTHASRLGAHASWAPRAAKQDFCAGVIDHKWRRSFWLSFEPLDRGVKAAWGRGSA